MPTTSLLERLPVGQAVDSVRNAILRESALTAGDWQQAIAQPRQPVWAVLRAEERMARQLGALGIVADAKLYRRLRTHIARDILEPGFALAAGLLLLQYDRAASEAVVFEQYCEAEAQTKHRALGLALGLCGIGDAALLAKLARAMTSREARVGERAIELVSRLGARRAWPMPNTAHEQGLCGALKLMRLGIVAPLAQTFERASQNAAFRVQQALGYTRQLLCPKTALEHCRAQAHRGRNVSRGTLIMLGLLHHRGCPSAERDLNLLKNLCHEPQAASAALEALGLAGRWEGAASCLEVAQRDASLVVEAARSLQAIFGLDDEVWAPWAIANGHGGEDALSASSLEVGLRAYHAQCAGGQAADFAPRTGTGLMQRLRTGDMRHLQVRADECHMRSQGRRRLYPWAYLTPQLAVGAPMSQQDTKPQAPLADAVAMPDVLRRTW